MVLSLRWVTSIAERFFPWGPVHLYGRFPALCRAHHKPDTAACDSFMSAKNSVDGERRIGALAYEEELAMLLNTFTYQALYEAELRVGCEEVLEIPLDVVE